MDPKIQVEACFCKMLLYEAGEQFMKHKDAEKEKKGRDVRLIADPVACRA
jgi:hypothetical protein